MLWREFRESADQTAGVRNCLRPRTARGANLPSDVVIVRVCGKALEGGETAFLGPYILQSLAPESVNTDMRVA